MALKISAIRVMLKRLWFALQETPSLILRMRTVLFLNLPHHPVPTRLPDDPCTGLVF